MVVGSKSLLLNKAHLMARSKKSVTYPLPLSKSPRPLESVPSAPMRSIYSPKLRVQLVCREGSGRTRQSFKAECDINNIMARFQRSGVLDFVNKREPQYMDCTGVQFQAAMDLVAGAQSMFQELPSSIRNRFDNDPAAFLDFVQDPENAQELVDMGLAKARPSQEAPQAPEAPAAPQIARGAAPGSAGEPAKA